MRIGGLGISEATKWGETPEIQGAASKIAQNAMTDSFVGQIGEMAPKTPKKTFICLRKAPQPVWIFEYKQTSNSALVQFLFCGCLYLPRKVSCRNKGRA